MPKIRRHNLPAAVLDHLLDRARDRRITSLHLRELYKWLTSNPEVPEGRWFKRFADFILCGEGELPKTFLLPGQHPDGEEVF